MAQSLFVALFAGTGATAALKGRWLLFVLGLILGPGVWACAFVLAARPRSWWYVHLYDDEKRERAMQQSQLPMPFRRR